MTRTLTRCCPLGTLSIFADLGIDEMDLGMLAGNRDLFPDEALAIIARKLGFGIALDRALDKVLGQEPHRVSTNFRASFERRCGRRWRNRPCPVRRAARCPSGVILDPAGALLARAHNQQWMLTPPPTPRSSPSGRRPARSGPGIWTAAPWWSPRAVHHVRRGGGGGPDRAGRHGGADPKAGAAGSLWICCATAGSTTAPRWWEESWPRSAGPCCRVFGPAPGLTAGRVG